MRACLPLAILLIAALASCGGGPMAVQAESAKVPETDSPETNQADTSRLDAMKTLKVYDAQGKEQACPAPEPSCPSAEPDNDFKDRCALAGLRIVQCGCATYCTGDINSKIKQFYDEAGHPKTCAAQEPDCSPPQASAAFQDACAERGYRLQVCGCEWLCSGNSAK
jgi:hypothetical protein